MIAAPFITVVICTRNRSGHLVAALESLRLQYCDRAWDVLVVDNGGSDDTAARVQDIAASYPVPLRIVHEAERGLTRARNLGVREAKSEILLFADDDVTFREGWLQAHAEAFSDSALDGSGGKVLPVLPPETPDWVTATMGGPTANYDFGDHAAEINANSGIALPFGANMGFRREAAERLGGFRADLGWGARHSMPGDDTDFFERLREAGGKIAYVPSAVVDHHVLADRLTMEYYEAWCEGFGRLKVAKSPPKGPLAKQYLIGKYILQLGITKLRIMILQRRKQDDLAQLHIRTRHATRRGALLQLLNR